MTAENKAKQLINDCWLYANKETIFAAKTSSKELAKICVREILEEVHNWCDIETMEQSKEYFKEVVKHIDNQ